MKNLTKLSIIAAALLAVTNVNADDGAGNDSDTDYIQVKGHVPPRCNIQLAQPIAADFEHNVSEGQSRSGKFGIFCNAKSGAKLTMESEGGGLALDGSTDPDHRVSYAAWWTAGGVGAEIDTGAGVNSNSVNLTGSKDLAMGMVESEFSMTLTDTAKFAGYYNDKISLSIEAN